MSSRRVQTALAGVTLAVLVAIQFSPILGCGNDCVPDLAAMHGEKLGSFEMVDVRLNVWILAWVQRALATAPLHLFDANAFYPATDALAGSEHMLGLALLAWPLRALTSNAVSIYAVTLALTSWLLAFNTYLLTRWLTESLVLSLGAAAVASFMPWRTAELAHIQLLGVAWFPLIWLLAMRVLCGEPGPRVPALLSVVLALQLLTSYYLAYLMTLSLVILCGTVAWRRVCSARAFVRFAGACAAPYALLAAFSIPYLARSGRGEIPSTYGMGMVFGGADLVRLWRLMAPHLQPLWTQTDMPQTLYYVPLVLLVAALASFVPRPTVSLAGAGGRAQLAPPEIGERQRTALPLFWLTAFVALAFMLGAEVRIGDTTVRAPAYWASLVIPGLSHFRAPHRWSILIGLVAPIVAAIGAQRVATGLSALRSRRFGRWARAGLCTLAALAFVVTVPWRRIPAASIWQADLQATEAYEVLADLPPGPVLELPWYENQLARTLVDSDYLVAATVHWHPILNGVTGYPPPSMLLLNSVAQGLPGTDALELLEKMTGLRWIVVHMARGSVLRARWENVHAPFRLAYSDDHARIYEVPQNERSAEWMGALRSTEERRVTISGVPRDRLPPSTVHGSLEAKPASVATAQLPLPLRVTIRNRGDRTWPGLDYQRDGIVQLRYIFDGEDGSRAGAGVQPLFADVVPGRPLVTTVPIRAPVTIGSYRLCLDLVQAYGEEIVPLSLAPVALDVVVTNLPGSDPSKPTLAGQIAAAAESPSWPSRCKPTPP